MAYMPGVLPGIGPTAEARVRSGYEVLGVAIPDGGQHDVVLEQRLQRAQDYGEAAGGAGGAGDELIPVAAEPGLGDLDKGGVLRPGSEAHLDCGRAVVVPVEEY